MTTNSQRRLALVVTGIGLVLMIGKIIFDSEPGAIPLLLVLAGGGWLAATWRAS